MTISFLLYTLSLTSTLYIATALLGICYGVQYSTMVPTASEIFGLKHFGIIYSTMALGNPIGAILFSALLAGSVYDAEAATQGGSTCLGSNCFRLTFLVLAGVCGLGTILSTVLTIRVRPVYQLLYGGGSFRLPPETNHWWCGLQMPELRGSSCSKLTTKEVSEVCLCECTTSVEIWLSLPHPRGDDIFRKASIKIKFGGLEYIPYTSYSY